MYAVTDTHCQAGERSKASPCVGLSAAACRDYAVLQLQPHAMGVHAMGVEQKSVDMLQLVIPCMRFTNTTPFP